jgi:uncharacterized membrane protein
MKAQIKLQIASAANMGGKTAADAMGMALDLTKRAHVGEGCCGGGLLGMLQSRV